MRFCSASGGRGIIKVFNLLILTPPMIPSIKSQIKMYKSCGIKMYFYIHSAYQSTEKTNLNIPD